MKGFGRASTGHVRRIGIQTRRMLWITARQRKCCTGIGCLAVDLDWCVVTVFIGTCRVSCVHQTRTWLGASAIRDFVPDIVFPLLVREDKPYASAGRESDAYVF